MAYHSKTGETNIASKHKQPKTLHRHSLATMLQAVHCCVGPGIVVGGGNAMLLVAVMFFVVVGI